MSYFQGTLCKICIPYTYFKMKHIIKYTLYKESILRIKENKYNFHYRHSPSDACGEYLQMHLNAYSVLFNNEFQLKRN